MRWRSIDEQAYLAPVQTIHTELLETFKSYHSPIHVQTALVAELVAAVRHAERERCIAVSTQTLTAVGGASAEQLASMVTEALRAP